MANIKSAIKRIKQSEKRRVINKVHRTRARSFVKRARVALAGENVEEARGAINEAISALDRAAIKGIIHPKNASRRKSRLMKALNEKAAAE